MSPAGGSTPDPRYTLAFHARHADLTLYFSLPSAAPLRWFQSECFELGSELFLANLGREVLLETESAFTAYLNPPKSFVLFSLPFAVAQ